EMVMPNFALLDQDGRSREVARTDAEAVVVAVVCGAPAPEPCASPRPLDEARRKLAPKGVAFWMMSSRLGEPRASLAASARALGADGTFPLLHDEAQIVARALGASRQGEVFAIDRRRRRVFFRGSLADPRALERALGAFVRHGPRAPASGPGDGAPLALAPADQEPVSYARDIAPLVRGKCVPCHRAGDVAPFAFDGHRAFEGWGATVQEVLLARRMPPWHADPHAGGPFANDVSLSPAEVDRLWRYVEQGAPRGDGPDPLAPPAPPVAAWPLGKPDYVVELPAVEHVPPTGVIPYQNRVSTFVMPRDAWLSGAFVQPDNRAVVHHVTIYAEYPKGYTPPGEDSYLSGWAPGMELGAFPPGTGKLVPKGTAFRFEVHYTPDGKPEDDRTRLGLYVAKGATPPRRLETRFAWDEDLVVPAGEPDLRTHAVYGLEHAVLLYDLIPHMHNRGSWVRYEALYPDGRRETLLSVPRYDFAWQRVYRLARPKPLPAGTWILITAGYDNSALNPANPDPRRPARWGEQTWDEMFVPQLDVVRTP
ncbi:MAG TPA: hypothetical protein VHL80_12005, partial [Polyangia bacterium]|nr:hypothetical protein [Polyangia bacterium]